MDTCKTCRFRSETEHWERQDYRKCDAQKLFYEYAGTGPAALVDHESWPADGLMFSDSEGYEAELYTGPDFGCIHHKEATHPSTPPATLVCRPDADLITQESEKT